MYFRPGSDAGPSPRTILTGDVELRDGGELDQLWDRDTRFAVFQYPHHGSLSALPLEVADKMSHGWLPVFSAGLANGYGHPHPSVLDRCGHAVVVDERSAFDYRVTVWGGRSERP